MILLPVPGLLLSLMWIIGAYSLFVGVLLPALALELPRPRQDTAAPRHTPPGLLVSSFRSSEREQHPPLKPCYYPGDRAGARARSTCSTGAQASRFAADTGETQEDPA